MASSLDQIVAGVGQKRCILLDLDDTLYAYQPCHRAGLAGAALAYRRHTDGARSAEAFLGAYERAREQTKRQLSGTAACHSRLLYFQAALEAIHPELPATAALELEAAYWDAYLEAIELAEWCAGFFAFCRREGRKLVIVSNLTAQIQMRKLCVLGIEASIDCLVTSEEVGVEKPDPQIFAYALRKVGAESAEAIILGDDERNDASETIAYLHCNFAGLLV